MPTRAARPCHKAGCPELTVPGSPYCTAHQAEAMARHREYDRHRPSAAKRLYDRAWREARAVHLAANPLCIDCLAAGDTTAATEVDHEIPHRGDLELFWDRSNWRSRCKPHHSRKTATQDSGFARKRKTFGSTA